jgi:hypothetical protein
VETPDRQFDSGITVFRPDDLSWPVSERRLCGSARESSNPALNQRDVQSERNSRFWENLRIRGRTRGCLCTMPRIWTPRGSFVPGGTRQGLAAHEPTDESVGYGLSPSGLAGLGWTTLRAASAEEIQNLFARARYRVRHSIQGSPPDAGGENSLVSEFKSKL